MLADWRATTPRQRAFLAGWTLGVTALAVVGAVWLGGWQGDLEAERASRHRERMGEAASATEPERTPPPGHEADVPRQVGVGVYVNRIPELSLPESTWSVDFLVWFTWQGEGLDPGETFTLTEGEITERELVHRSEHGGTQYARYRVHATITKAFSVERFPRDRHLLTIAFEDAKLQSYQLAYVPDLEGSAVSSRVGVEGYAVRSAGLVVRPHGYKSRMGDPAMPPGYRATYAQAVFGLELSRPSWGVFAKLFLALFISVVLSILALLLRGIGERLAVAGTGLFVAIINAEVVAPMVSESGKANLGDAVHGVGYVAIGLVLLQAIFCHRYFHDRDDGGAAAATFDRLSFALLSVLYVAVNAALVSVG